VTVAQTGERGFEGGSGDFVSWKSPLGEKTGFKDRERKIQGDNREKGGARLPFG